MIKIKVIASGSKGNCIHIASSKVPKGLIFDAGIHINKMIAGLIGYDAKNSKSIKEYVDAVCISHDHQDHSLSITQLVKRGLKVIAPKHTLENHNLPVSENVLAAYPGTWIFTEHWNIMPVQCEHDIPNVGYWVYPVNAEGEDHYVFFATDTACIRDIPAQCDYLVIECNYDRETLIENMKSEAVDQTYGKRVMLTHMGLETLIAYIHKAGWADPNNPPKGRQLRQIQLIHMSAKNCDWERCKRILEKEFGVPVYLPE